MWWDDVGYTDEERRERDKLRQRTALTTGCGAGGFALLMATLLIARADELFLPLVMFMPLFIIGATFRTSQRLQQLQQQARARVLAGVAPPPRLFDRAELERTALRIAAANEGYVTPARFVLESSALTLAQAEELLQQLADEGQCVVETDEDGLNCYRFRLDPRPSRLSAAEWVAEQDRLTDA